MLKIKREKTFIKDLKKVKMSDSQYQKYISYIFKLINKEQLPPEAKDHSLLGEWKDIREFHLGGDLLVLYKIDEDMLYLIRIGSHSQLFKKF